MADDVFNGTTPAPTPTPAADPFAELVGDGKKFKTPADLAKAKLESDAFIKRLETENAEMRKDIQKAADAQAMLEELRAEMVKLRGVAPAPTPVTPGVSADDVRALVNETITNVERNRTAQQNITAANDAVVRNFGSFEKAGEAVRAKAAELGMSLDDLKAIAAKSPTAFEKIVLGDKVQGGGSGPLEPKSETPASGSNGGSQQLQPGTKAYYDDMRVKQPGKYWSTAVQMALHKAVKDGTYEL